MKRRFGFCLMGFAVAAVLGARAQEQSSSAPSQQEPSQTESQPAQPQPAPSQPSPASPAMPASSGPLFTPSTPPPAAEEQPAAQQAGPTPEYVQASPGTGNTQNTPKKLDFLGAELPTSTLSLGVNVQGTYNTNIGAFSTEQQGQGYYTVGGNAGISVYRSKLGLSLNYSGGLGMYDQLSNGNTYTQTVGGDVLYQLSSRWQFHANDSFSYTANPFNSYYTIVGTPTPENPNPNIYVPFAVSSSNQVQANLAYVLNRYDTITFSGSEYFQRISHYAYTGVYLTGLYNTINFSGGVNYSHKFSPKLSVGGGYTWTTLDFSHGEQRTGISAFQIFTSYQVNKSLYISFFAGPEHVTSKTIVPYFTQAIVLQQADWVPSYGLTVGWQGLRDSLFFSLSRQVSSGGGLLATTTIYGATAGWHRKLSAHWDGTVNAGYSNNTSFAASNLNRQYFPDRKYTLLTAGLGLNRRLTQRTNAALGYSHNYDTQKNIYVGNTTGSFSSNQIFIQVSYSMTRPLGR